MYRDPASRVKTGSQFFFLANKILCHICPGLRRIPLLLLAVGAATASLPEAPYAARQSVVKLHVTHQPADYRMPWMGGRPGNSTGSGFIIKGQRILTNAHIVSDVTFLQVQKDGDARRYAARVSFVAHDCDLAILTVEDPAFFEATEPLTFATQLPALNEEVTVLGYPLGGDRLSVTRGVVSRIDYSVYAHSGVDEHLVMQVDAAINPGNSGGPVLYRHEVVALAFQGLAWAENIGYAIPLPVIRRFLEDIADGQYDGYPELGIVFMNTLNEALRRYLHLQLNHNGGIAVSAIDPFGSAFGMLKPADVLLSIDGHHIQEDGNILLEGNQVIFAELLERKQIGDHIDLVVLREGALREISIPLQPVDDTFFFRRRYDKRPEYMILGGLVFAPLSRDYLNTLGRPSDPPSQLLAYLAQYATIDNWHRHYQQFVVLTHRLPADINAYADPFLRRVVSRMNQREIRSMQDLLHAAKHPVDGFHHIEFIGHHDFLVMDATQAEQSMEFILQTYSVDAPFYLEADP